jgi:glycolate oxidase iron-sulfur subunit
VSERDESFRSRFPAYADTLDCVHCGLCIPHCPTHGVTGREADSPRGRIHLMRGWAEGRNELSAGTRRHLDLCIVCRACESVCPSGIRMGEMMESFRHATLAEHPTGPARSGFARFLLREVLPHRERIARITDALELYQRSGLSRGMSFVLGLVSRRLERLHALQPAVPPRRARRIPTDRERPEGFPADGERRARVALFLGCIASEWFAVVNRATIRVLQRNGCDVIVPHAQTCCGALHRHAGLLDDARELLARNTRAFGKEPVDAVIVNAAGCGASLKEPLEDGGSRVPYRDVCEFLHELGLQPPDRPLHRRVAYDQPCHLVHGQRIGQSVVEGLLRSIPELELVPLHRSERCCGAGGVYNLMHAAMSDAVLAEKVQDIVASGADIVATGNPGCAMQIRRGLANLSVTVAHPVELLDQAYSPLQRSV